MRHLLLLSALALTFTLPAQVHMSYLWHLQQPIYWPEVSQSDPYRYQPAWESNVLKFNGGNTYSDGLAHPLNDLQDIFSNADRVAVYQYRAKDAVQSLFGHPEGGAQVNYSGCLIENVNSLGNAGQWGYSANWAQNFITARNWQTSGGHPRMDLTGFTFHHALSPLIGKEVLRKEIQAHKLIYGNTFGTSPNYSKGYWPAECSFSERIIDVLVEEGFEWSIIANSHLARTLADYPIVYGTNGTNYDPPNKADQVSTTGNNWWSGQIDGRGGQFAAPYSYQAHKAQYIDPNDGSVSKITVVPMADLLSYQNGFATMGTGDIDAHIAPFEDPAHPSIVLFAHDGDNAWGGGFDYYNNSVPGLAGQASSQGYVPTTIQQFLSDHPVPENDVVHVEDGSWFNAANDWGHPQFINWIWPMQSNGVFDPNGWTEDARNWAVLIAAENHVLMAEDIEGDADIQDIVYPSSSSSVAERAWHHLLPGYTSGYMYYGTAIDMEVKQSLAANIATDLTDPLIASYTGPDQTPPSVFIPQRFPYNPGGKGYGPVYGYQLVDCPSDFYVWTFAHDVNGLSDVQLKYRVDFDGENPIASTENETYAGGSEVGPWQSIPMTQRIFPAGNITGNGDIDFFIMPDHIADEYYGQISGLNDTLVDYYVEATDMHGNVTKTDIQHVWVGANTPIDPPGETGITWSPQDPDENDIITITVHDAPDGGRLHWGINGWSQADNTYWPAGSFLFQGSGPALQSPMTGPDEDGNLTIQIGPFNDEMQEVDQVNFVINYDNNTWDNNNGQDYLININDAVGVDCSPFDTAPVDLTKSFQAVNGVQDRLQLKWYKASPQIKYSDEDAAACDIKFWKKRELDPETGLITGPVIQNPDTILLVDKKKFQADGVTPRSIFKWPVRFRADGVNNSKRVDPNFRYQWQVRCACEHGEGQESPWSEIKIFNTPDFDRSTGIYNGVKNLGGDQFSKDQLLESGLNLYPDGSTNGVYVEAYGNALTIKRLVIQDVTGRIILEQSMPSPREHVDLSSYGPGMYFFTLLDEYNLFIETKKLILE